MNDLHYTDSWMIYNYIILTLKCFTLFVHHLTTLVRIMHLQIQSSPCVFDQRRASWKLTREEISAIKLPSLSWLTWFLGNFPCACFHLHCFPSVDQTTKERNMWTCQWSGKPVELCVHVQQSQLATLKVWNWNKSITVSCGIWAGALLTLVYRWAASRWVKKWLLIRCPHLSIIFSYPCKLWRRDCIIRDLHYHTCKILLSNSYPVCSGMQATVKIKLSGFCALISKI